MRNANTEANPSNAQNVFDLVNPKHDTQIFNSDASVISIFQGVKTQNEDDHCFALPNDNDNDNLNFDFSFARNEDPDAKIPYKHTFPRKFKEMVVNYAKKYDLNEASKKFRITKKNIERWQMKGFERKKGAGRKTTNPMMEKEMLNWVENYISREKKLPKRKFIIQEARRFVSDNFKASKGWCDKFLKRNKVLFAKWIDRANEAEA